MLLLSDLLTARDTDAKNLPAGLKRLFWVSCEQGGAAKKSGFSSLVGEIYKELQELAITSLVATTLNGRKTEF